MSGRSILITGCSSGIGYASAHELKKRGWRVFAAARQQSDADQLAAEGLEAFRLDYMDEASIVSTLDEVLKRTGGKLDALFNNGAYGQVGAVEDLTTAALRDQFEANFFGWHELTRRVVPVMRAQGAGRIVQCSSVLGFVSGIYRGAYASSKHALEGLTDALRMELRGTGIQVVLIEPGPIRTNFVQSSIEAFRTKADTEASAHRARYDTYVRRFAAEKTPARALASGPEDVVKRLIKALESPRPKARYRVTLIAHGAYMLSRFAPTRLMDAILSRQ